MFQQQKDWETRENAFAAFTMGPLTDFWRQRDEAEFTGVDDIPVRFVRFRAQHHDRVVVICPGRIESYVKYAELAYDLFHLGFDVLIIDHRGQGRSGRLLAIRISGMLIALMIMLMIWRHSGSRRFSPVRGVNAIYWHIRWAVRSPHYFCNAIQVYVTPLR